MNFTSILKSLFGDKSSRDMKLIQPLVEKAKSFTPQVQAMSNDELRARTKAIQQQVQSAAKEQKDKIAQLKATIEDTPIDERETIFNQIDKLEKEALDVYEKALDEVMFEVFAIVKETARRFAENEDKYEGDFKKDLLNGKGTYYCKNGDKYEGNFEKNKAAGSGTYTYNDGNKYEGGFKNDKAEGEGIFFFIDGDKFCGNFKEGVKEGKGTYYYINGNKYEGDFKNDKADGIGVYSMKSGAKYEGGFKDNKANGKGTYYYEDGVKYEGFFLDGKAVY